MKKRDVSLTVSPNPLPQGTDITVSGENFESGEQVLLDFSHAPAYVNADNIGAFVYTYEYPYNPGNAAVRAFLFRHKDWVQVAEARFTIVSA